MEISQLVNTPRLSGLTAPEQGRENPSVLDIREQREIQEDGTRISRYVVPPATANAASGGDATEASVAPGSAVSTQPLRTQAPVVQYGTIQGMGKVGGAANTILDSIVQRLNREKIAGADDDALQALFDQGMAGFTQGYGEAHAILAARDQLSTGVEASITTLYDEVIEGLGHIAEHFQLDASALHRLSSADNTPSSNSQVADVGAIENDIRTFLAPLMPSPILVDRDTLESIHRYSENRSFDLSLQTQEGDTVSIRWAAGYQYSDEAGRSSSETEEMFIAIDGDLDESERQAIFDVLNQANTIAQTFYGGQLQKAFEASLQLNFDREELVGYTLSLHQSTETVASVPTYSPAAAQPAGEGSGVFAPLVDFIDQIDILRQNAQRAEWQLSTLYEVLDISTKMNTDESSISRFSLSQFVESFWQIQESVNPSQRAIE